MTAAAPERIRLDLEGMTCASCATRIEKRLTRLDGVDSCSVNYATEEAAVTYDPGRVDVDDLVTAVSAAGYGAHVHGDSVRRPRGTSLLRRLVVAAALTVPLTLLAMVPPLAVLRLGMGRARARRRRSCSGPAGRSTARPRSNARHRAATMDTLISIGTLAAWTWSAVVLVGGIDADTYFEVGAVITTLILLGRYFEARAKRRAGAAMRALLELGAKEARVLRDGDEVLVPIEELRSATASSCAPARRSPPTASSSEGGRRSTSRC